MRRASILLISALLVLTVACGVTGSPLAGTSWNLTTYHAGGATMHFSAFDNSVKGWTGCNTFKGDYSTKGDSLSFTSLGWTEAGCPTNELREQEAALLEGLIDVQEWAVNGFSLTLTTEEGTVLRFEERR